MLAAGLLTVLRGLLSFLDAVNARRKVRNRTIPDKSPEVASAVFVPCRGIDPGFDDNIRAILSRLSPRDIAIFVTDSADDPAHVRLQKLSAASSIRSELVVAGPAVRCSQKIHNLLAGLPSAPPDTEYLIFADSDIRPGVSWRDALLSALDNAEVGASTGYRWYVPFLGNFWSFVRSVWNMTSSNVQFNDKLAFAWGGSMAMRRKDFERLQIAARWRTALSDDLVVTQAVRGSGMAVRFVPEAVVPTFERITFRELMTWVARQLSIVRLCAPKLWHYVAWPHWVFHAFFLTGVSLFIHAVLTRQPVTAGAWLLLSELPFGMVINWYRFQTYRDHIAPATSMNGTGWHYAALSQVSSILMSIALLVSALGRKIVWRGVRYKVAKDGRIEVIDSRANR